MTLTSATNRYDKYKDSGIEWIGEIPDSWLLRKFKYIFKIISGNGFPEMLQGNPHGDYPFCKCSDINGQKREIASAQNYVDQSTVINYKFNIIPIKSIIIAKIGEALKKNHRKINIVKCVIDNNMEACAFQNFDAYNIIFYFYILTCIDMLWFDNGGTIPSINNEKLKNFYLPCTSIKEQGAIAGYLDKKCGAIDETIEKQKSVIEKLKEYKQSIITQAVTKGLDKSAPMKDSGIEWIGQIPKHWEISKIKFSAIVNPKYNENLSSDTLVSFAPMECLTNCNLECKDAILSNVLGSYTYFANNDIIMAKVTPCFENGNIALATNLNNGVGFGSSELYVFRSINIFDKFLLYLLQNTEFKDNAIATMYGTGGLKRVSIEFVKNYKFACPDLKEQEQIAEFLDKKCSEIDKTIEDKEKLIEKLVEYKKSLIYECVTGKRKAI